MEDKELLEAFLKEIHYRGWNIDEAMEKLGFARSTFFNWQKGNKISNRGRAAMSVFISNHEESNAEPVTEKIDTFPVISEAAAAEASGCCYVPISDWADEWSDEKVSFSQGRPGDFVIRVTGTSMLPWYPAGTLVLVRPNVRVRTGERVVAVLDDGSVVFKTFAEKGDKFYLFSLNDEDGKDFAFSKKDHSAVRALYPVIQSMRDERALDKAMSDSGIHHRWESKLENL